MLFLPKGASFNGRETKACGGKETSESDELIVDVISTTRISMQGKKSEW